LDPADAHSLVGNPIKRVGYFNADKTAYPYTMTDVPKINGYSQYWKADAIKKTGQSSNW
jgi:hypothetical protein